MAESSQPPLSRISTTSTSSTCWRRVFVGLLLVAAVHSGSAPRTALALGGGGGGGVLPSGGPSTGEVIVFGVSPPPTLRLRP